MRISVYNCIYPSYLGARLTAACLRLPNRMDKVQKRASNVMRLAEQNEKLKAELRAMTERLEAAERRQRELAQAQAQKSGGGAQRQASGESAH